MTVEKKAIYKRVWLWLLAAAAIIALISGMHSPEMAFRLHRVKLLMTCSPLVRRT